MFLQTVNGVPLYGTPIFLFLASQFRTLAGGFFLLACLLIGLAGRAQAAAAPTPAPALDFSLPSGNTATAFTGKAVLFADAFHYEEAIGSLHAQGHVKVWYGAITLTADEADADVENNLVHAQGAVELVEAGRSIKCAKLDYNLKDRSAKMHGIVFASYPWYYQGESVKKEGEKKVDVNNALFTTCNARHPHYHMTAERIEIVLGESLTAYNAVIYVGTTPLFYIPWFTRNLKDKRAPYSVQVGYDNTEGVYTKFRFNYYLEDGIYGALLLDVMEKKGLGYGLSQKLQYNLLGKGSGDLSVLYVKDKETHEVRWTANASDRHDFSPQDALQLNVDYLSDQNFDRDFSSGLVDSFQQKSYLSYSHRSDYYFYSLVASDTEDLDPTDNKYYPLSMARQVPAASFSLSSLKLTKWRFPLYFNLNSSLTRSYEQLGAVHDYRYRDDAALTPALTETYTLPMSVPTQPSLSGSLSFPLNGNYKEEYFPEGQDLGTQQEEMNVAYNTTVTLTNKWVNYRRTKPTYLFQSRLSYNFLRQFPVGREMTLPFAGVTSNLVGLGTDYYMGDFLTLQADTGYNLTVPDETVRWQDRMNPLTFNGRAQLTPQISFIGQGQHSWSQDRITSAFASGNLYAQNWNLSGSTSYSYIGAGTLPYSLFGNITAGVKPVSGISLTGMAQYDFTKNQFTNYSLNLTRDLHCWEMQAGFKLYADGNMEIGLGINLKAFPEVKVGMGGPSGVTVGQ